MDEEVKDILKHNTELLEENHKILVGMRRSQRWSTVFFVLRWVLIIGSGISAYYYFQPTIDNVMKIYGNILGDFKSFNQGVSNVIHNK